jgi:uncharacterized membrane protein
MSMQYSDPDQRMREGRGNEWRGDEYREQGLRRELPQGRTAQLAPRGREETNGGSAGAGALTKGLGLFSLVLGIAELAAPRQVARLIGVHDDEDTCELLRACGLREITSGMGILTRPNETGWLWSRVGGDVMDLALLGSAMRTPGARQERLLGAVAAVAGVTVLDMLASQRSRQDSDAMWQRRFYESEGRFAGERLEDGRSRRRLGRGRTLAESAIHVKKAITIQRPHEELYQYWHNLENLPRIMSHLETVEVRDAQRSHWKAKMVGGVPISWDAQIIKDEPNTIIAWESLPGADIKNAGSVRFKPTEGGSATQLVVELYYLPPGGMVGRALAKLFGEVPEVQLVNDLRRFKQVIELGEVVHSDASIHRGPHAARPTAEATRLAGDSKPVQAPRSHRLEGGVS